ncbi:MAG: nicotinate (nicotinamide) nucleotide adenylyltransferase [Gemmatimonadales bacterium]|nr:nicotinate (nicotinamide) nucleotide adenylyltransferase [Gemmatimonadales bacterium]MDZ4389846.1 nicotinate (nicotinamide) nucleotide adenylyltransferase [Gemmatimonadales bacterium]
MLLPIPDMRLGILGGSFDPIHHGHLIVAQLAREQLGLDRVLLMVAASQPLKSGHAATADDRVRMAELAVAGIDGLVVDRRELDRAGPSFTVDTLRSLAEEQPGAELVLLLGADAARGLSGWRNPEVIRELARLAVFVRGGEEPPIGMGFRVEVPRLELSSTAIRARARAGLSLAGWVPPAVAGYISGLALYGTPSEEA